jgi:hypothetical protein
METEQIKRESLIIILTAIILGLALSYSEKNWQATLISFTTILLVILVNVFAKKFIAYNLETNANLGFWSMYWYGFTSKSHYSKPMAMAWLPLLTSLISKGIFIWMPILTFEVSARPERIARRHGLYKYTAVTDWHIAIIAVVGIVANIIAGIAGYLLGFETFAKWSIFYAVWSIIPIGNLDGTKIFFGSRKFWFLMAFILAIILLWGLTVI